MDNLLAEQSQVNESNENASLNTEVLRKGCYVAELALAVAEASYVGTFRVSRHNSEWQASADLYVNSVEPISEAAHAEEADLDQFEDIPVFPIKDYRFYVEIHIRESQQQLELVLHRYDDASERWNIGETYRSVLDRDNSNESLSYVVLHLLDRSDREVGTLRLKWVSKFLRKAKLGIQAVKGVTVPGMSGELNWSALFAQVDWDLQVLEPQRLREVSGHSWSMAELHEAMLNVPKDLDSEWRYQLTCVRLLDDTDRGLMYDVDYKSTDSNAVPREGVAIASDWKVPNTLIGDEKKKWGDAAGKKWFEVEEAYFRTAVHEICHAMGLYHNTKDNGIMNATNVIATRGTKDEPFPTNIAWRWNEADVYRLRHMPDMWVRPGGRRYGISTYSASPVSDHIEFVTSKDFDLSIEMVDAILPLGAPARIELKLKNSGKRVLLGPSAVSLRAGTVHGRVIDQFGISRSFHSLFSCTDEENVAEFQPNDTTTSSETVLRGAEGALFPAPGLYTIEVCVAWLVRGAQYRTMGTTSVMVTPAVDQTHAMAAMDILTNPDVLLAVTIAGDHLDRANRSIDAALECSVLRPHYAYLAAKRFFKHQGKRRSNPKKVAQIIGESMPIVSEYENEKLSEHYRHRKEK